MACSDQCSLLRASVVQQSRSNSLQYWRKWSTHRVHLLLYGRSGRELPHSFAITCQSESLHVVTRWSHESAGRLATCPAQFHLILACSFVQSFSPAHSAAFSALCVTRWIHGTNSSSGARAWPTILLSIAWRAVWSNLISSTRRAQEDAHHNTQPLTVE